MKIVNVICLLLFGLLVVGQLQAAFASSQKVITETLRIRGPKSKVRAFVVCYTLDLLVACVLGRVLFLAAQPLVH